MKNNMISSVKSVLYTGVAVAIASATMTSCSLLDKKPLDQLSPDAYHLTAEQLGGFTINYYPTIFNDNRGWFSGIYSLDNGTDNQAAVNGNAWDFLQDEWRVPGSGGIGFNEIRNLNKFINETEAKQKEGKLTGSEALINHYIGEAYVIRAMLNYGKLKTYGDYPILLEEINTDADLKAASKRMPRNLVARQILKDLDKAIGLLQSEMNNKQRITKNAALVLKSRVALFEGTFELYHRGTGRVPGDQNWPGKDKEWNKGFTINQQAEVDFFLTEAMSAAKAVADQITLATPNSHVINPGLNQYYGWNPYYQMFADPDLSKYPEVLLWKQYKLDLNIKHITSHRLRYGAATGWTRSLVQSFLMKNGLPIYASGSGYKGDETIDLAKTDRDERLQLFVFGESDALTIDGDKITKFTAPLLLENDERRDVTGYRQRKFYNYEPKMHIGTGAGADESGAIFVRVEEAYLNYMEASYIKTKAIDGTARKYWDALRARAGITAPIETTIAATNMSYEADLNRPSYDWAAFSHGQAIDATLYSIRRERRSEFAGEGGRWDDLKRWAAMDQVKNYQVEGVNLWTKIFNYPEYKGEDGSILFVSDGGETANMSGQDKSKYLRPYQKRTAYNLYNGYTFYQAHYLSPFSYDEMVLTSPTGSVKDAYLYQNIYWPYNAGGVAEK